MGAIENLFKVEFIEIPVFIKIFFDFIEILFLLIFAYFVIFLFSQVPTEHPTLFGRITLR